MSYPTLLIPFSLPPPEHAKDLANLLESKCGMDGLALLLSRHSSLNRTRFDDFSHQLPHETWLNDWLSHQQHQRALLTYYANSLKVNLTPGYWFILNPVHLHVARNHLVLTDFRQLALTESQALLLFDKAKTLCGEEGKELVYGNVTTWFLRADNWAYFETSTPDAACGHNIEIWSPKGENVITWRKLQNEIQMEWFMHPLQEQREQRGEKVINGLWLWGGCALANGFQVSTHPHPQKIASPTSGEQCLAQLNFPVILLDKLSAPALANDWGAWANTLIELENTFFKPLCAVLKKASHIKQLELHLSNANTLLSIKTSGQALRKFWRTPTFKNLIP